MNPLRKLVRFEPWPDKPLITINRAGVIFILCGILYVSSPFIVLWVISMDPVGKICRWIGVI